MGGYFDKNHQKLQENSKNFTFLGKTRGRVGGGGMPIFEEVSGGMGVLPVPSSRLHPGEYDIEGV